MRLRLSHLFSAVLLVASISTSAQPQRPSCATGVSAYAQARYAAAIQEFSSCLATPISASDQAELLEFRAEAQNKLGNGEKSIADQRAAIAAVRPTTTWPYVTLAIYQREALQFEAALITLRTAEAFARDELHRSPGSSVYYHLGRSLCAMGRCDEAIEEYSKAIGKQPRFGETYFYRAMAYEALQNKERARSDLIVAARLTPLNAFPPGFSEKLAEYGVEPTGPKE